MSLSNYNKKRRFNETPEPKGAKGKDGKEKIFVVQRHKATRLHYDFRLEMNGTLKSWAVPKGPSLNPADKRLAMMVEDHPIDYATFHGVIPEGNYGAGIVEVWDHGTYELGEETPQGLKAINNGSLKVVLHGKKLKGKFALVKLKNAENNAWLLIKDRDNYAVDKEYNSEDDTPKNSPINKALAEKPAKKTANKKEVKEVIDVHLSDEEKPEAEKNTAPKKAAVKNVAAKKSVAKKAAKAATPKAAKSGVKKNSTIITVDSIQLELTNTNKIFWPDEKITKGDVIDYYNNVYKYIALHIKDRPQSMRRTPHGIADEGFFQKNVSDVAPDWAETITLYSESAKRNIEYFLANNKASLLFMANLGCIELNPWNSSVKTLDKPDYLVIDLDPSDKNSFDDVVEVALVVKELLDKSGAVGYAKTSGSSGMHIYIPLCAKYSYEECKTFGEILATLTSQQVPNIATVERTISKRNDKLYVDFLQNRKGQTLACAYSLRPKPGATVSMPLDWKEVKKGLHPSQFNIKNAVKRIEKKGDLFKGVLGRGIDMHACLEKIETL